MEETAIDSTKRDEGDFLCRNTNSFRGKIDRGASGICK